MVEWWGWFGTDVGGSLIWLVKSHEWPGDEVGCGAAVVGIAGGSATGGDWLTMFG